MSRRRVGWLMVGLVVLALSVMAGPTVWRNVTRRETHRVDADASGSITYARGMHHVWQSPDEPFLPVGPIVTCAWWGDEAEPPIIEVKELVEGAVSGWYFDSDGTVATETAGVAPPHSPAEVRQLIHDAKLYVQAAAQRGEVTLPDGWERVE